jgi:homoserine O-succinyltransferase/O-acetyltransferase
MSLLIDRGERATPWSGGHYLSASEETIFLVAPNSLQLALVINMPDAAVEDTEAQFFGLLEKAANGRPVHVRLYSLPHIPRGERTREYLGKYYASFEDLLSRRFDGAIITGTEPKQPDLRQEPYWNELSALLDWAEQKTFSTVLSCLAAHAGVLYSDGIGRNPLGDKQFGVFEHQVMNGHALTKGAANPMRIPHSRWNEVREENLVRCGYEVLTKSNVAGVDLFVKQKRNSLFVHFQGHPEYGGHTLLKEYRRDIKRYLRRERDNYPSVPAGYFDAAATQLLTDFRALAEAQRQERLIDLFPEQEVIDTLQNSWKESAARVYQNWLDYITARKAEAASSVATVCAGQD